MELELYDCPYCLTNGVLITRDGKCPHCKAKLDEAYKRPKRESDLENDQIYEDLIWEKAWERKRCLKVSKWLKNPVFAFFCGVICLLTTPLVFLWMAAAASRHDSTGTSFFDQASGKALFVSLLYLLVGLFALESGFRLAKIRHSVQTLLRIPIYLYICLLVLMGVALHFFNTLNFP